MKRISPWQVLLLCLPMVAIAIVATIKIQSRQQLRAHFSQPFAPRLEITRGQTPRIAGPSLFQIDAHCLAIGGSGESSWLIRAQLFDISNKKPREIWNSQKMLVPGEVGFIMAHWAGIGPVSHQNQNRFASKSGMMWRFQHYENGADNFKMLVEAVAVPFPSERRGELGTQTFNISEATATATQIATARQQPGARYFQETLVFKVKDDGKFLTP